MLSACTLASCAQHSITDTKIRAQSEPLCVVLLPAAAEVHYVVRFFKDPKTNKAWLLDMQGNKVPLKQQPVVFGNLTIVPVDKVLMSGTCYQQCKEGTTRAVVRSPLLLLVCGTHCCCAGLCRGGGVDISLR
jgi:hypothetical protein